ncbi:hypothetical protein HAX54_003455 [Datura stramonium]|uniref:Uncharacterized protein n=1 Tax=Datura stramonium TaxID=4076 RepID=A0ABS8T6N3_DATST|nr:hypothetical protein [Datura stramonium]
MATRKEVNFVPKVKEANKESTTVLSRVHKLQEGKAKILYSGKGVGNLGKWKEVKLKSGVNKLQDIATIENNKLDVLRKEEDNNEEHSFNNNQGTTSVEANNNIRILNADATSYTTKVKKVETTKQWIERSYEKLLQVK